MKDEKNFFDVAPPEHHTKRVESAVADLLTENRRKDRRKWMAWIAAPTFASIAGFLLWRKQQTQDHFSPEQAMLLQLENEEDLEILADADMDVLEDLDFLEEWDGSTEEG